MALVVSAASVLSSSNRVGTGSVRDVLTPPNISLLKYMFPEREITKVQQVNGNNARSEHIQHSAPDTL